MRQTSPRQSYKSSNKLTLSTLSNNHTEDLNNDNNDESKRVQSHTFYLSNDHTEDLILPLSPSEDLLYKRKLAQFSTPQIKLQASIHNLIENFHQVHALDPFNCWIKWGFLLDSQTSLSLSPIVRVLQENGFMVI